MRNLAGEIVICITDILFSKPWFISCLVDSLMLNPESRCTEGILYPKFPFRRWPEFQSGSALSPGQVELTSGIYWVLSIHIAVSGKVLNLLCRWIWSSSHLSAVPSFSGLGSCFEPPVCWQESDLRHAKQLSVTTVPAVPTACALLEGTSTALELGPSWLKYVHTCKPETMLFQEQIREASQIDAKDAVFL